MIITCTPRGYVSEVTHFGMLIFDWLRGRVLSGGSRHVQISHLLPDTDETRADQSADNRKLSVLSVQRSSMGENSVFQTTPFLLLPELHSTLNFIL